MNYPDEGNFEKILLKVTGEEKAVMEKLWHISGHLSQKAELTVLQTCQCLRTVAAMYEDMAMESLREMLPKRTGEKDDEQEDEEGGGPEEGSYFRD